MGHAIGVLMGYVIPELLLAYFSAGISAGAKAAVKTFRVVFDGIISPIMKGARVILSSVQEALSAVRLLLKHVSNYVAMLVKSGRDSKLGKMIQEMLEGIENFLKGKADEAIEEGLKKGDELPGGKKVDEAVDSKKVGQTESDKALEDGGVKKDDPDYGEKAKALLEAKVITEAADAIEPTIHPSILVKLLGKAIKSDKLHFEYQNEASSEFELKYVIWMIGSKVKVGDIDIEIPDIDKGFNEWFNRMSADDFDELWKNDEVKIFIERKIREPKKYHEWLMVKHTPKFKRWGITMEEIKELRTLTKETNYVNPIGKHGSTGSGKAHIQLSNIIEDATSYDDFKRRLNNWANYRLPNGRESLPPRLLWE